MYGFRCCVGATVKIGGHIGGQWTPEWSLRVARASRSHDVRHQAVATEEDMDLPNMGGDGEARDHGRDHGGDGSSEDELQAAAEPSYAATGASPARNKRQAKRKGPRASHRSERMARV